jgi:hypothetical protein
MMASSAPPFQRMASATATVKRPAALVDGKRGAPALVAGVSLPVFPLMPLDAQTRQTIPLDTPHRLLMTYTEGSSIDLNEGDLLVIDSVEYPVKRIARWPYDEWYYYEIIVEERDV